VYMRDLIAPLMPLYRVKFLLKIGPVVSAENRLTDGNCIVVCVFCQIYPDILDRFSQSFHLMNALRANDGSVPYFPICQGTLPWQPNNVAI